MTLRFVSLLSFLCVVSLTGCGPSSSGGNGDGETSADTSGSAGDAATTGAQCGPGPDFADGESCDCNEECNSGTCFDVPLLGSACGECTSDDDCPDGGCTVPNPSQNEGSKCNEGGPGAGCSKDESCQDGLTCEELLDIGAGAIVISGCSECATDDDCTGGQLCTPDLDIAEFKGQHRCVDPGSVGNGLACDPDGNGDMACASGMCAVADVSGLVRFGVCGDCRTDDDCPQGETCLEPMLDINTFEVTPSMCDGSTGTGTGTGSTGTGTGTGTGGTDTGGTGTTG